MWKSGWATFRIEENDCSLKEKGKEQRINDTNDNDMMTEIIKELTATKITKGITS